MALRDLDAFNEGGDQTHTTKNHAERSISSLSILLCGDFYIELFLLLCRMRQPQLGHAARLSIGAIREAHRNFVA